MFFVNILAELPSDKNRARWRYFQIFGFFAILFYLVGKPRPLGFGHDYLFMNQMFVIESPRPFESADLASEVHKKNMLQHVSTRIFQEVCIVQSCMSNVFFFDGIELIRF